MSTSPKRFFVLHEEDEQKLIQFIQENKVPLSTACSFQRFSSGHLVYHFHVNGTFHEICEYPSSGCHFEAIEFLSRFVDM